MFNMGTHNNINIRIAFFDFCGNLFLLHHTTANSNYCTRIFLLDFFGGAYITVNPILRVLANSTGIKYYKICFFGFFYNGIAHKGEHPL